ncbi:MAG: adenosine kinase [Planctomycetota bacterium]|jgi:sugar/nucleoside kinase (ribokinase family)|nr:adenosine kinase [Planctomycetota bacterium]
MDDVQVELIGVGSPLVDLVLEVSDDFLATKVAGDKGGMVPVDLPEIEDLINAAGVAPAMSAGGAASNTTVGCAALGIGAAFIGSCGQDEYATYYKKALETQGCETRLVEHPEQATGRVLSLITPDAERTMRTFLGAAAVLDPAAVTPEMFAGARVVMLEGYTLFNHDLTWAVAKAAKAAGCELALDLASFEVVNANKDVIEQLLDDHVDLVFANEDEARAWRGDTHAALEDLSARCKVAVVKLGAEGAWIAADGENHHVGTEMVEAVDTTGAGDNWAAGFLAGYLRGLPMERCGQLGAMAGAAVVQIVGAQIPRAEWQTMRGYLDAWA